MKIVFLLLVVLFLFVGFVSAISIPIYVRPLDDLGGLVKNVRYDYNLVFSDSSDCSSPVFNSSLVNITTDNYGVGYGLVDVSGVVRNSLYICEYKDNGLRKVHSASAGFFSDVYSTNLSVSDIIPLSANLGVTVRNGSGGKLGFFNTTSGRLEVWNPLEGAEDFVSIYHDASNGNIKANKSLNLDDASHHPLNNNYDFQKLFAIF